MKTLIFCYNCGAKYREDTVGLIPTCLCSLVTSAPTQTANELDALRRENAAEKEKKGAMERVLTEVANLLGTPQGDVEALGDEIRRLQSDSRENEKLKDRAELAVDAYNTMTKEVGECAQKYEDEAQWNAKLQAALKAEKERTGRLFAELEAERKEVERLRTLIGEAFETMNHAETFVASREKMHPPGQELYREGLEDLSATKEHGIEEGT